MGLTAESHDYFKGDVVRSLRNFASCSFVASSIHFASDSDSAWPLYIAAAPSSSRPTAASHIVPTIQYFVSFDIARHERSAGTHSLFRCNSLASGRILARRRQLKCPVLPGLLLGPRDVCG